MFIKYQLHNSLNDQKSNRTTNSLDIATYMGILDYHQRLKQNIIDQIQSQIEFWNNLSSNTPDLASLLEYAQKATNKRITVEILWNTLQEKCWHTYGYPFLLYGTYLSLVNYDNYQGDKLIKHYHDLSLKVSNAKKITDDITDENAFADDVVAIVISGSPVNLGKIIECSYSFETVFGYKKDSTLGKNISFMMPTFYRVRHDDFLRAFNRSGREKLLHRKAFLFGLSSEGYLIPFNLHVTMRPNVQEGISYVGLLKPVKDNKRHLLIDVDGIIHGASENLARDLGLTKAYLESSPSIFSFCKHFDQILSAFVKDGRRKIAAEKRKIKKVQEHTLMTQSTLRMFSDHDLQDENEAKLLTRFTEGDRILLCQDIGLEANPMHRRKIEYQAIIKTLIHQQDMLIYLTLDKMDNSLGQEGYPEPTWNLIVDDFDMANEKNENFCKKMISSPKLLHFQGHISSTKFSFLEPDFMLEPEPRDQAVAKNTSFSHDTNDLGHEFYNSKDINMAWTKDFVDNCKGGKLKNRENLAEPFKQLLCDNQIPLKPDETKPLEQRNHILNKFKEVRQDIKLIGDKKNSEENTQELQNNLKNFQKRLNNVIIQMKVHQAESVGSISSMRINIQRMISLALKMKHYKATTIIFSIIFLIVVLIFLALLLCQGLGNTWMVNYITDQSQVLQASYQRTYWLRLAVHEARLSCGIRGGLIYIPGNIDESNVKHKLNLTFSQVNYFNNELRIAASDLPDKYRKVFYENNINMYSRNSLGVYEVESIDSNFVAFQKILNAGFRFAEKPFPSSPVDPYIDDDSGYIFYNSINDLLISNKLVMESLEDHLWESIEDAHDQNLLYLLLLFGSIGAFILISIHHMIVTNLSFKKLSEILTNFETSEVKVTKETLNKLQSSLKLDLPHDKFVKQVNSFDVLDSRKVQTNEINNGSRGRKLYSHISVVNMYKKNGLLIFRMLLSLLFMMILMIVYFVISEMGTNTVKDYQSDIVNSLNGVNGQILLSVGLQQLIMDNSTTELANKHPIESLLEFRSEIDTLEKVIESYFTTSGGLTVEQKAIFFGFNCDDSYQVGFFLAKEDTIEACKQLAGGKNVMSLTDTIAMSSAAINSYIERYEASNKTSASLADIFKDSMTTYIPLNTMGSLLYFKLYETAKKKYQEISDELLQKSVTFTILAIPIGIIIGAMTWIFVIRNILEMENEKNKIIAIIPTKMILSNLRLKKWLKETTPSNDLRHLL